MTSPRMSDADVVVVGAGIVGLAVAREIRRRHPALSLTLLEAEGDVARHQSGHNSGVIHSGVYYTPGSLKARLCVEGATLMYQFCDEHAIAYERCGKLIVALEESELPGLDELERRGRANGVSRLRRLDAGQIAEVEPGCRGVAALHCPDTGIVDYRLVAAAMAEELRESGASLHFSTRVVSLRREGDVTLVETTRGLVRAGAVVTCAGLWSDRLAVASGADRDPRIIPFRGAYVTLNPSPAPVVRGLVYPVPNPDLPFLGVHVTKLIDGDLVLGPTALLVPARDGYRLGHFRWRDLLDTLTWPGTWRLARRFWRAGLAEVAMATSRRRFLASAARYVPVLTDLGLRQGASAGVRAQALGVDGTLVDDFVLSQTPGAFHVRNAPSPAATSSLALAAEIVDRLEASPSWTFA